MTTSFITFLETLKRANSKLSPPIFNEIGFSDIKEDLKTAPELVLVFEQYGIMGVNISQAQVIAFKILTMHVDNVRQHVKTKTIIFPLKGRGELSHFQEPSDLPNKIKYSRHYPLAHRDWRPLFLDDSLPHSFCSNQKCLALVLDVIAEDWEKFKLNLEHNGIKTS